MANQINSKKIWKENIISSITAIVKHESIPTPQKSCMYEKTLNVALYYLKYILR
jgi:hypothetical protein